MPANPYILMDEILALFKKNFDISMSSQNLYGYINAHGFPKSSGMGRPRKLHRVPVMQWFKEQNKKFNAK